MATHGIILRTSATYSNRYAYFPLPHASPIETSSNINIFTESLANAPYFPHISILDSVSSNILYKAHNYFPHSFHVYNLINQSYFAISFPYLVTFVNAAIIVRDCSHFKIFVVCINKHPNPFLAEKEDSSTKPLVFYLYSSESGSWSFVPIDYILTSDRLLFNRRKPIHAGENIVYIDLTHRFLITFGYSDKKVEPIPKLVSKWEKENNLIKLDEGTRYGECKGQLHCVKYNPLKMREEVYIWKEPPMGMWKLVLTGKDETSRGKVMEIHPDDERFVLMRSMMNDEVSMVDIQQNVSWVIIEGKGENCSPVCFNQVLEASTSEDTTKLQHSSCNILHPYENENVKGLEGEFFFVSINGSQLVLPPQDQS